VAPTLVASYFVQQNTTAGTAISTPSFTPSNGEVVIVKLATWDTGTAMGAPAGGSQTYTSRIVVAPGGFRPWVGIYTAVISGSPGSMTISSTPAGSARYSMTVERWSSATLAATPATNSGGTTNGGTGAAASALTTTAANSVLSWVAGDTQSLDPATRAYLGSATDEGVRDGHVGSNGVEYYAYQAVAAAGSTSFGLSAPTGMQWGIAGIEVLDASGGAAPAFPPVRQVRRRLPRPPRGRAQIATPVRAQVNPPFPFTGVKQPRRLRGLLARRAECFMPVPAQAVVTASPYPPQPERARLKVLRLFRGRVSAPPLAQDLTPAVARARVKGFKARARMEAVTPVPSQVVLTAPPYPIQSVRTRLRGLRIFRGRTVAPVPGQIVIVPPSFTPLAVRARLKWARPFRPRASAPVADQQVAPPPVRPRLHGLAPRRGHIAMPVPPQVAVAPPAYPPRPVRSRLKGLRQSRGREAAMPVPPQIVIPPPPYSPVFTRLKKKLFGLFRPSTVTPVAATCDCTTHRPNLGTTSRPGSGITARPDAGTTGRPCSCGND
jgi:hypothetical protein